MLCASAFQRGHPFKCLKPAACAEPPQDGCFGQDDCVLNARSGAGGIIVGAAALMTLYVLAGPELMRRYQRWRLKTHPRVGTACCTAG